MIMPNNKKKRLDNELALVDAIVVSLTEKKAEEIIVLNVSKQSSIANYFVIANGIIDRHVDALAEEVKKRLKEHYGEQPIRIDGLGEKEWVIVDYGNIIVHIFTPQQRQRFRLEELWESGRNIAKIGEQ